MSAYDLNRDQLNELKGSMLFDWYETTGKQPSYGELLWAEENITDDAVHEEFEGVTFSDDDFFCTMAA